MRVVIDICACWKSTGGIHVYYSQAFSFETGHFSPVKMARLEGSVRAISGPPSLLTSNRRRMALYGRAASILFEIWGGGRESGFKIFYTFRGKFSKKCRFPKKIRYSSHRLQIRKIFPFPRQNMPSTPTNTQIILFHFQKSPLSNLYLLCIIT